MLHHTIGRMNSQSRPQLMITKMTAAANRINMIFENMISTLLVNKTVSLPGLRAIFRQCTVGLPGDIEAVAHFRKERGFG